MAVERRARIGRVKPRVTPRIGRIKPRDIAGRLGGQAIGVRVRIESSRGSVEASALVNTGFETPNPQILLPVKAAERLGL